MRLNEAVEAIRNFDGRQSYRKFISENRDAINSCIKKIIPDLKRPNSEDRLNFFMSVKRSGCTACKDCFIRRG